METLELIERLSVALAIGLLIGIERGWHEREEPEGSRAAGVRSLALAGLLGGIWAALVSPLGASGAIALGLAFAVYTGTVAVYRFRETEHEGTFGVTTVIAAMLAFALGAFAVLGDLVTAAAAGIGATAILAMKSVLHDWVRRLTWVELRSGLLLLAMTFVMLPLLPDRPIDPWQALNPYRIWLMTIAIAAISFTGYAAVRAIGAQRGILVTGVAGGLVSSTAVTLTLAGLAQRNTGLSRLLAAGMVLASGTMMVRVVAVLALFAPGLLGVAGAPIGAAALVMVAGGVVLARGKEGDGAATQEIGLQNPFDLATVLQFGALLAAVLLVSRLAVRWLGEAGVLTVAALSGLADVDAITLSMARLGGVEIRPEIAAAGVGLAVVSNTLAKIVLAVAAGGGRAATRFGIVSAAALAVGIAVAVALVQIGAT